MVQNFIAYCFSTLVTLCREAQSLFADNVPDENKVDYLHIVETNFIAHSHPISRLKRLHMELCQLQLIVFSGVREKGLI